MQACTITINEETARWYFVVSNCGTTSRLPASPLNGLSIESISITGSEILLELHPVTVALQPPSE